MRGVASSRISARKGFYTVLVGLLSAFSFLNVKLVLTAVKKELHSANSSKSVSFCSVSGRVVYIDAKALSSNLENPHILWEVKVHYTVHKSPSLIPILSHMRPVDPLAPFLNAF